MSRDLRQITVAQQMICCSCCSTAQQRDDASLCSLRLHLDLLRVCPWSSGRVMQQVTAAFRLRISQKHSLLICTPIRGLCLSYHIPTWPVLTWSPCRREAFVVPFIPGTVPGWSDACFEAVAWPSSSGPPRRDGDQGWCIVRSPATDADGWVYGTAFDHLREDRPGGRASKRANDRVRSRLWRRLEPVEPGQQQQVRQR